MRQRRQINLAVISFEAVSKRNDNIWNASPGFRLCVGNLLKHVLFVNPKQLLASHNRANTVDEKLHFCV